MNKIPTWHFGMLNDQARNQAFHAAIRDVVDENTKMVDLGAGTGLLSILASQAGANAISAYEANPHMAHVAAEVIKRANASNVTLHAMMSTEMTLGPTERANCLVTETFDCAVIGEGIIPTLRHARANLLDADYKSIPQSITLRGRLLASSQIRSLNEVADAEAVDVRPLNTLQTRGHFPVRLQTWQHEYMSNEVDILHLDLQQEPDVDAEINVEVIVRRTGVVHGLICWFNMQLTPRVTLSTEPGVPSHWMQAFVPLPEPLRVQESCCYIAHLAVVEQTHLVFRALTPVSNEITEPTA